MGKDTRVFKVPIVPRPQAESLFGWHDDHSSSSMITCRQNHCPAGLTTTRLVTPRMTMVTRARVKAGDQQRHSSWSSPSSSSSPAMEVVKRIQTTMSILQLAPKLSSPCAWTPDGLRMIMMMMVIYVCVLLMTMGVLRHCDCVVHRLCMNLVMLPCVSFGVR